MNKSVFESFFYNVVYKISDPHFSSLEMGLSSPSCESDTAVS